jgi:uncharacterized protein YndB with AHSA1/START domain
LPISVQAVSKHLKVLERAGLVTRGRMAQLQPSRLQGHAVGEGSRLACRPPPRFGTTTSPGTTSTYAQRNKRRTGDRGPTRVRRFPSVRGAAWADPAQPPAWWGRRGWHIHPATLVLEVRPGGHLQNVSANEETGERMTIDGLFEEAVEPERLSFAHDDASSVVTFRGLGDGRTDLVVSSDQRMSDGLRRRATAGLGRAFDRLADHLQHINHKEHA